MASVSHVAVAVVCESGCRVTTVDKNGCGLTLSLVLAIVVYDCVESSCNDVGGPPSFYYYSFILISHDSTIDTANCNMTKSMHIAAWKLSQSVNRCVIAL
jgi:hypothetical protein